MKPLMTVFWMVIFLLIIDVALNVVTIYPDNPRTAEISSFERYFNYGRTIESKVRWMTADDDASASRLALSGWMYREQERHAAPEPGRQHLIAFYGMSFTSRIGHAMRRNDDDISVRLSGGPGGTVNRSYADYLIDRGEHSACVVVLGVLASSLPAVGTVTHMTWNFENPSSHFYPRYVVEQGRLMQIDPPVNTLEEFREVLNDPVRWPQLVEFLRTHDAHYESFVFDADPLDASTIGRLVRRAWAQRQYREVVARYHDGNGFTGFDDSLLVSMEIFKAFAAQAGEDGTIPIVLLINDQGFSDHLDQAFADPLTEAGVPYFSTASVVSSDRFANFEPDGHFLPEIDERIAAALLTMIKGKIAATPCTVSD